jgi:hypothetical protein
VRRLFGGVLAVAMLVVGAACGPSFQVIYEGNARFEHCYALEENAQTLVPEKADCWRDWSEHYTFGQTRDRIHYATARYVALSQSTNVPTDEAMMMAAPGMTPRQSTITAPAPTNAFAPPPKVLEDYPDASAGKPPRPSERPVIVGSGPPSVDAGPGSAGAGPSGVLPAADCGEGCARSFRECNATCASADAGVAAGAKTATCVACEKSYKGCMRGCFK